MRRYCLIFPLLLFIAASCGEKAEKEKSVLSSLLGREVTLPDSLVCRIQDTEIDYDMGDADFKIITYVDSSDCTTCRMKLPEWDKTINGFMSNDNVDVAFLMIVTPKQNANDDVRDIVRRLFFRHPMALDMEGNFVKDNNLPEETMYHTLLLDADNRIVAVGNPALNPKIREVYSRIINGEEKIDAPNLCPEPVATLGAIGAGDTIVKRFALNNRTAAALTIQEIVPSCDCVSAVASSGVIQPD
ncbi:MAG: redoxin family protein, partial [Paramuribaculum sp.]|nr:redoxin family protein [Paramuribaculum sp.]